MCFNVNAKTIKLLEKSKVKYLHYLGIDKGLLNRIQKALIIKGNTGQNFFSSKDSVKEVRGQATEWVKVFLLHVSTRELTPRMEKRL